MRWAATIAAVALSAGCGSDEAKPKPKPKPEPAPAPQKREPAPAGPLRADILEGISTAKKVRAQRIRAEPMGPMFDVSAALVAELTATLSALRADEPHKCEFVPGIHLWFDGGVRPVEVVLCFTCREAKLQVPGAQDEMVSFESVDPALVAIARALFPDDPEIQALH